ncbi:potassium channel family protein [Pontiella sulfatireligans]|uniref:Voltage-gated potassium channel Kch n=1 Tax=Pontiella sulfatireligans TaxID=2750658 RepID=A0A6C2USB1_9BACT|nr:potassium channel protein [Pontiella sulfatireligans]VGO22843.1 Voltage-gated potassium channel Kch [Pontiella sulfatireligans]
MRNRGFNERLVSGLAKGAIGIATVLATGVAGYRWIEGWNWSDSFYMTVITVSTVGFDEVHELSGPGRIFTALLIFCGVGVMAFCLTRLVEFLFQRSLSNVLGRRTMMKKIAQMKNHAIICGYGRTGSRVVAELLATGTPFVVIEEDEETVNRLEEQGIPCIKGDATEEDALEDAQVSEADSLVAALDSDAENLYLTLTASGLCPSLRIIARVHDPDSSRKFHKAGAKRVVSPISSGANQIAQLITSPSVLDLIELVTKDKNIALQVFEYPIDEESDMLNKTLSEARVRQTLGSMVIAVKHRDGHTSFDPGPDTRLKLGDTLVAIRQPETNGE